MDCRFEGCKMTASIEDSRCQIIRSVHGQEEAELLKEGEALSGHISPAQDSTTLKPEPVNEENDSQSM